MNLPSECQAIGRQTQEALAWQLKPLTEENSEHQGQTHTLDPEQEIRSVELRAQLSCAHLLPEFEVVGQSGTCVQRRIVVLGSSAVPSMSQQMQE